GDPAGVAERAAGLRGVLGAGTAVADRPPPWWARVGSADRTVIRIAFWAAALPGVLGRGATPGAVAEFLTSLRDGLAGLEPGSAGGEGPPARASAVVLTAP